VKPRPGRDRIPNDLDARSAVRGEATARPHGSHLTHRKREAGRRLVEIRVASERQAALASDILGSGRSWLAIRVPLGGRLYAEAGFGNSMLST
jgi:hypothetical protein